MTPEANGVPSLRVKQALDGGNGARRRRRSTAALRQDILEAAREVFSEKGYAGTTVREVAERASAAEHLIFKHFGTKASLFTAAVFEPLDSVLDGLIERVEATSGDPGTREERVTDFARTLVGTLREHRQLFLAFLGARAFHADELDHWPEAIPSLIDRLRTLEDIGRRPAADGGVVVQDWLMESRAIFGMVLAMAVLDDLLLEAAERDEEREVAALVKLITYGVGVQSGMER